MLKFLEGEPASTSEIYDKVRQVWTLGEVEVELASVSSEKETVSLLYTGSRVDLGHGLDERTACHVWNRRDLIQFAEEILRTLAPTTEQKILGLLEKIERRLANKSAFLA